MLNTCFQRTFTGMGCVYDIALTLNNTLFDMVPIWFLKSEFLRYLFLRAIFHLSQSRRKGCSSKGRSVVGWKQTCLQTTFLSSFHFQGPESLRQLCEMPPRKMSRARELSLRKGFPLRLKTNSLSSGGKREVDGLQSMLASEHSHNLSLESSSRP